MSRDPMALWRAQAAAWGTGMALWRLGVQAQTVIALRSLAMAGLLPKRPGEDRRMVEEKVVAFGQAALAAGAAAARGGDAGAVTRAAIRPLSRRAGSNVTRLTRPPKPRKPRG